jgi:CheY-like chemotaxis protein
MNVLVLKEAVHGMGEVHFAGDGLDALEFTRHTIPDIVLLDIEMPGMDGYAVCNAIKLDPRYFT